MDRAQRRAFGYARRGQTIVVALLVLLLLGLVGAVFVTIVARNLINARHANRVVTADYYARAGITFTDAQLTYSPDGADWRPPLQVPVSDGTNGTTDYRPTPGTRSRQRYDTQFPAPYSFNASDPDFAYLSAGFARYNTGAGRFLLRVTYDPVNLNRAGVPPGKYLKIESIGREGVIDFTDPTTYANNRSTDRTQAILVAYKPIGIMDYARFETNPDKRSDIANLGVVSQLYSDGTTDEIVTPGVYDFKVAGNAAYKLYPILTTYGASNAYLQETSTGRLFPNPAAGTNQAAPNGFTFLPGGGSMRSNMSARYYGQNIAYLYDAGADAPSYQDTIEIVGDLLLDGYQPTKKLDNSDVLATANPLIGQRSSLIVNPPTSGAAPLEDYAAPSNDNGSSGGFYSFKGLVRDGSSQNDSAGQPRGIARLEPPQMDGTDPASSLPRYKVLAMTSPPRVDPSKPSATNFPSGASAYGYGTFPYVDNTTDVQTESVSIGGGTNLTDEWLNRSAPSTSSVSGKGNWHGLLYSPPGVNITLGELVKDSGGTTMPGIRMVRSDSNWKNPDGTPGTSEVMDASYKDMGADNDPATTAGNVAPNADNDIIIYAEGNVRLHGTLSPPEGTGAKPLPIARHITIVTNATAYIDGNLLKGSPDSSITVLAHDYVCVNTTQFLAGAMGENQSPPLTDKKNMFAGNAYEIQDALPLVQEFSFGLPTGPTTNPITYVKTTDSTAIGGYGGTPYVYVSAASDTQAQADFSIAGLSGAVVNFSATQTFSGLTPTHVTFPLTGVAGLGQADAEQLTVSRNQGADGSTNTGNVLLERVAVLPMDIRIEAVLFAQTRSFFVIPGDWFNTSPDDNLSAFASSVTVAIPAGAPRHYNNGMSTDDTNRFPFYGQPIDLKITIDGAVSEARPANVAAQTAWMLKWGWIPQYHGSLIGLNTTPPQSQETAGRLNRVGLQIIYNPQAGYPYNRGDLTANPVVPPYYLRSDQYGRPLPFAPKLPVSVGLLYAGQSGDAPILQ